MFALAVVAGSILPRAFAWDYEGHRVVNQIALASLPNNFPAFVRTLAMQERIAFLGGEPDRWRNTPDLALKHFNGPDHYIDLEELAHYGLKPETFPPLRYDFVAHLGVVRAAHPENFPAIDPAKNEDHTRELVGLLPWAITEYYGKLKSGFSYLKAFETHGGTPDEIANAQADIVYIMGVMGHFVADAAQPLHTTIHHHGWVGANPHGYTTNRSFHGWIDGGYFLKIGGVKASDLRDRIRPAQRLSLRIDPEKPEELGKPMFQAVVEYIVAQHKLLEPLYQLDKAGKLSGEGERGLEGKAFLEKQLVVGGQMLGDIWYSAWQHATPDKYLEGQLDKRKANADAAKKP